MVYLRFVSLTARALTIPASVTIITSSAEESVAMTWHEGRPRLKLTGHCSAEEVDAIFASFLVDVAYVIEETAEAVYIVADDAAWPTDRTDYDWLCSIIKETLANNGIQGVELSLVPRTGQALSGTK
jgi:hypothetical protein